MTMTDPTIETSDAPEAPEPPAWIDITRFASEDERRQARELAGWMRELAAEPHSHRLEEARELLVRLELRTHGLEADFAGIERRCEVIDGMSAAIDSYSGFSELYDAFLELGNRLNPDDLINEVRADQRLAATLSEEHGISDFGEWLNQQFPKDVEANARRARLVAEASAMTGGDT